jgi:hypothetical protein
MGGMRTAPGIFSLSYSVVKDRWPQGPVLGSFRNFGFSAELFSAERVRFVSQICLSGMPRCLGKAEWRRRDFGFCSRVDYA